MENGNGHHKNYAFGEFDLETELQTLRRGTAEIHLAKRPFDVLLFLIENRERVVSRDELLDKFWDGHDVYDDALRKCVGAIRKAIEDENKPPHFIETRRGSGYRFVGKIENRERKPESAANGFYYESQISNLKLHNGNQSEISNLKSEFEGKAASVNLQIPDSRFQNRPDFSLSICAVVLVAFAALAFFSYRSQPKNVAAKTLTETVATKHSLAILPLKNLTGDAVNDYLSDGITESLINEVSRIESLKVISRSSAFQFKDKNISAQEIGEKLGVETILEGSLRQSGDNMRVEVRLVNTKDGSVIWTSDSEQKKLADIFTIQNGIACQIVTALKVKLCGEVPPSERYTNNVKAYQLYLQGLYYRNRLDTTKAIDFFNQSLQVDPNYALAHEGLASTYALMELNTVVEPGTAAPLAELHANKALELDDSLAGAYLALGVAKTLNNYDLTERERYYRQALLKNPNHRTAHLWLSGIYTARGEFEQAEAEALRAQEIDPLSYGVRLTLADIYFYWRKPDKVIEQADLMLALKPDDEQAFSWLALAHAQKGDFEKAFADLEKLPPDHATRITVLVAAGRITEARKLAEIVVKSNAMKNRPYEVAEIYAAIGDKETAFAWLEKSYRMRQANLVSLKVDPAFDNLHDDARYQNLLRRVNLAE